MEMERSVRLALISDIHANFEALEATFYDIAERSIDRIVCLGDIVGYNSDAAACIALIRGADCVCVAGNHDLAACGRITTRKFPSVAARAVAWTRNQLSSDDLDFLENLPLKANIGNRVIAVHGALHPETGCESVRLDNDEKSDAKFRRVDDASVGRAYLRLRPYASRRGLRVAWKCRSNERGRARPAARHVVLSDQSRHDRRAALGRTPRHLHDPRSGAPHGDDALCRLPGVGGIRRRPPTRARVAYWLGWFRFGWFRFGSLASRWRG